MTVAPVSTLLGGLVRSKLLPPADPRQRLAWLATARREQLPPLGDDWSVWFILAGRGWGKTRTGAEHVAQFLRDHPGCEVAIVGRTDAEARRLLLNGPSGLRNALDPAEVAHSREAPGDTILVHVNGSKVYVAGANSPDALRGLNLWMIWCDELAAWRYQQVLWDEVLEPALRIGPHPHFLVTTTPKPTRLIRTLLKDADARIVRGSTFDNLANLAPKFIRRMRAKYDGTRAGRQELHAEVLDDVPGALLTREILDASRVDGIVDDETGEIRLPDGIKLNGLYREAVVALDPADGVEDGDEQAIAVVGLGWDHGIYVEETIGVRTDVTDYLRQAIRLAVRHQATMVVEKNHGSAYLIATLAQVMRELDVVVPYRTVRAADGKRTRAEPIVPLFTAKHAHMVGVQVDVEDQMTSWVGAAGEKSPDRLDALVWGVTHFLGHRLGPDDDDGGGVYAYDDAGDDWSADGGGYDYGAA